MGYSHSFTNKRFTPEEWLVVSRDSRELFAEAERQGIKVRGPMGEGDPELGEGRIAFNGDAGSGESYETFWVDADPRPALVATAERMRERVDEGANEGRHLHLADYAAKKLDGFDETGSTRVFCKTNHRPYDPVVQAFLLRMKYRDPSMDIASDGEWDAWAGGVALAAATWPDMAIVPCLEDGQTDDASRGWAARSGKQRRQPRGTGRGGQFAPGSHDEPTGGL